MATVEELMQKYGSGEPDTYGTSQPSFTVDQMMDKYNSLPSPPLYEEEEEDESFYQSIPPSNTIDEAPLYSLEPTLEDLNQFYGYTPDPMTTRAGQVDPSDPGMRFEEIQLSLNKSRQLFLQKASQDRVDDVSKQEYVEKYVLSLINEANLQPGYRPYDAELDAERKKRLREFATKTTSSPEEAEDKYDDMSGLEDSFSYGSLFYDENRKEYAYDVFFKEVSKSNLSPELKAVARKKLHELIDLRDPLSTTDRVMQTFMYDPSKIKSDEAAGAESGLKGDVAKALTLPLNMTSGLLGAILGSAAAPFLNEKYYTEGEAPLDPKTNFYLLNNAASDVFEWDEMGKGGSQDVLVLAKNFLETGVPDVNDVLFKKITDISRRSRRIELSSGPGIAMYSPGEVLDIVSNVNKDKDKIKAELSKLIFADPKSKYFLGDIPAGQDRIAYIQNTRETKEFQDLLESKFKTYSSVNFAEDDYLESLRGIEKKYAQVFQKYFPLETKATKSAKIIEDAIYYFDNADLATDELMINELRRTKKSAMALLDSVPPEYRSEIQRVLEGGDVSLASLGFPKSLGVSPVVLAQGQRQSLINRLVVQYAQKEEIRELREKAQEGKLGERWQGKNLKGTPKEIAEKKKILHAVAPHMIAMESMLTNPTYGSTMESYYKNFFGALRETPYQAVMAGALLDAVSGTDIYSKEQQDMAIELWKQDPGLIIANLAALTAIGAKAAKARIAKGLKFTAEDFAKDPVGSVREAMVDEAAGEPMQSPAETLTIVSDETSMTPIYQMDKAVDQVPFEKPRGSVVVSPEDTIGQYKRTENKLSAEISEIESLPDAQRDQAKLNDLKLQKSATEKLRIAREKFRENELEGSKDGISVDVAEVTQQTVDRVNESIINDPDYTPDQMLRIPEDQRVDISAKKIEKYLDTIDEAYKSDFDKAYSDAVVGRTKALEIAREYGVKNIKGKNLQTMLRALVQEGVDDYRVWKYVLDTAGNPYIKRNNATVAKSIAIVRNSNIKVRNKQRRQIIADLDTPDGSVPVQFVSDLMSADGTRKVAARTDRRNNRVLIDRAEVERTYKEKAWTDPKMEGVEALPENAFRTVGEWQQFLIEHERAHFSPENTKIPKGAARENDANIRAMSATQDPTGPASVISKATRENPDLVQDRFDSLAIADELAAKGVDRPDAYFGLNLTNEQIMGFVQTAQRNKKSATIVKRVQRGVPNAIDQVKEGPFQGGIVQDPKDIAKSPRTIYGTARMPLSRRVGRTVARTIFGDNIFALNNAYARTGNKRYVAYAVADYLSRPFAIVNMPEFMKNAREEALLHLYSDPNPDIGLVKRNLIRTLEFFNKDSAVLGANEFYQLRLAEGAAAFKIDQILRSLPLEAEFNVTPELLAKYFEEIERLEQDGNLRTFNLMELHELGSVIARMSDAIITDRETGKQYKFGDYVETRVDAKKFLERKLEAIEDALMEIGASGDLPKIIKNRPDLKPVIDHFEAEKRQIISRLQSGDVFLTTRELGLDMDSKRSQMNSISEKLKTAVGEERRALIANQKILRTEMRVMGEFDNQTILSTISDAKYYPKVDVKDLDDFQKSTLIFANEFVKPRRDVVFDLVTQIMVGEDSVRLLFTDSIGFQNNVVRILPDGTERVVERFEPTQKGEVQAQGYRQAAIDRVSPAVDLDKDMPGAIVLRSDDELAQAAYLKRRQEKGIPTPTRTTRLFDPDPMNLLDSTLHYISDYFDLKKVSDFLDSQLENIATGNTEAYQVAVNRAAMNVLTAIDGGMRLLEQNNGDIKKTIGKILSMTVEEQKQAFRGKTLSTDERFFFEKSFDKAFTADQNLKLYADYQGSFQKTVIGLQNTLNTLNLQNHLQQKGFILNASEFNSLPKNIQAQYINAEKVKTKKGEQVLPTSLNGAYINKRIASFFRRQTNLQEAIRQSGNISSVLNKLQQVTKTGLVIDVINNSIARNLYSMIFVQGMLQANIPVKPKYYVQTAKLIRDISSGKVVADKRVLRIIKSFSSDTSIKRDIKYSRGAQILSEFVEDLYGYAEETKAVSRVEKGDALSDKQMIESVRSNLAFEEVGFQQKVNSFLEKLKTEENLDADVRAQVDPTDLQKAANALGVTTDFLISLQTNPDLIAKIAYAWQLEESGYKPQLAYAESLRTFVDYVDVPSYLNFLRYGGSGVATGGFFGMLTSDFITFSAAQAKNYWDTIANHPIRSAIYANVGRSNDRALEETLKLKRKMMEIRSLKGDPTFTFLPGYTIQSSTGREFGPSRPFIGGPAGLSMSMITGQVSPVSLFGVLPVDVGNILSRMPRNFSDWTFRDLMEAQTQVALQQAGGAGNQMYEAAIKKPSEQRQKRIARNNAIERGVIDGEKEDLPQTTGAGGVLRVLGTRLVPRIVRSTISLFDGSKRKDQIYGQLLGLSVEPFDYQQLTANAVYPVNLYNRLNKEYRAIEEASRIGDPIDGKLQTELLRKLESIEEDMLQNKTELETEQQYMFLLNEIKLLAKLMAGEITYKELLDFRAKGPLQ